MLGFIISYLTSTATTRRFISSIKEIVHPTSVHIVSKIHYQERSPVSFSMERQRDGIILRTCNMLMGIYCFIVDAPFSYLSILSYQYLCGKILYQIILFTLSANLITYFYYERFNVRIQTENLICNPSGGQNLKSLQNISLGKIHKIYSEYISTSVGKKWLQASCDLHGDDKAVFLAVVKLCTDGTCTGWTYALIEQFAQHAEDDCHDWLADITEDKILFYTFFSRLASSDCLIRQDKSEMEYEKVYKKWSDVIDEIRNKASTYQRLPLLRCHKRAYIGNWNIIKNYEAFFKYIEKEIIINLENEGMKLCMGLSVNYGTYIGHRIFVQLNGGRYRFCCNEDGFYEYPNRSLLYQGLVRYIQPSPVKEVTAAIYYSGRSSEHYKY